MVLAHDGAICSADDTTSKESDTGRRAQDEPEPLLEPEDEEFLLEQWGARPRPGVVQFFCPKLSSWIARNCSVVGGTDFRDGPFLGSLFESLVTLGVRVGAQRSEARVAHFRTHRGEHEIDLIVERRDGRCVALEVKLSPIVTDADVRHLRWLQDRIGPELLDSVVVTTGTHAYRRPDGIAVVPAALLGP